MWTYIDEFGNKFIKGSLPWNIFGREEGKIISSYGSMEIEDMIGPHEELIEVWGNIK